MQNGFAMSLFLYTMTCERESPENIRDDAKVGWVCKQGLAHRTLYIYRNQSPMASDYSAEALRFSAHARLYVSSARRDNADISMQRVGTVSTTPLPSTSTASAPSSGWPTTRP